MKRDIQCLSSPRDKSISTSMEIFVFFRWILLTIIFVFPCRCSSSSSCVPCRTLTIISRSCYHCLNEFPLDRSHVEQVSIVCQSSVQPLTERFFSIIQSYSTRYCPMKTFYLDQFTLWNYLESMSITYAHLTRLSPVIFNRSLSISPILYSIKTLNFSHNTLRLIHKNFSVYFPSLERLDLSYNQLRILPRTALSHFRFLKELHLHHNHLKDLSLNFLPRQSLRLINLNSNPWHCSCSNVLTLAISRPIPRCRTPVEYRNENAGNIARQCFLRTKATISLTTNLSPQVNFTCALSSTIDIWKNKSNTNLTLLAAWHIEQQRSIDLDYLYALSQKSEKYLICFNLNSTHSQLIHTIIPLMFNSSMNPNQPAFVITQPRQRLSPFFHWLLNTSRILLPKSWQNSDKQVLIIWLILLLCASSIFSVLIYYIYYQYRKKRNYQVNHSSARHHPFVRFDRNSDDDQTIFNLKFHCHNHRCLCQYRQKTHSTMLLSKSNSIVLSNLDLRHQPLLIQPTEFRYAKIKRISSSKNDEHEYLAGHFRTIVKFKHVPN